MLRMLAATPKSPPLRYLRLAPPKPGSIPTVLPLGEFGRQNQDHLQFAASNDARVGIEKNPALVQIASEAGGLYRSGLGLDRDRHPRRNPLSGATFTLDVCHEKGSVPQRRRRSSVVGLQSSRRQWLTTEDCADRYSPSGRRERTAGTTRACSMVGALLERSLTSTSCLLSLAPVIE